VKSWRLPIRVGSLPGVKLWQRKRRRNRENAACAAALETGRVLVVVFG
jgi:hypothetical protein